MRRILGLGAVTFLVGLSAARLAGFGRALSRIGHDNWRAPTPLQLTWTDWSAILRLFGARVLKGRFVSAAAAVAFFALLAFVPGLSIFFSIYGLVADPATIASQIALFYGLLPETAVQIVSDQAQRLATTPKGHLSAQLLMSFLIAGWGANAAMKAMFEAVTIIDETRETRSWIRFNLITLGMTISSVMGVAAILFLLAVLPALWRVFPQFAPIQNVLPLLRWPVVIAMSVGGFATLFWFARARHRQTFVWCLPGAILASMLWLGVSSGFAWYAGTLSNYSAVYGSLAAVIVFMTWLWLSACTALLGAILNSAIEQHLAASGP